MKNKFKVVALVSVMFLVLFMLAGCNDSKTSLTLNGNIEFSEIASSSQVSGLIVKFNKGSGEQVKKGDVIAVVDNSSQKFLVSQLSDVVEMKKAILDQLKNGSTKQAIEVAQFDLDQAQSQLDQAKVNLKKYNISALEDGVIVSKNYDIGSVVNIGSDVVDIAVTKKLYVTLFLPVEYLGSISYGQELNVTTTNGLQKGKVTYIALKNEYVPNDLKSTADKSKATKVKVEITNQKANLKPGMTATVELPIK